MKMTPCEICREYHQAKNPGKQIDILADLNRCTPEEIKAVLQEAGELKKAAAKEDRAEIEMRLIELVEQEYSNAEIAEKMGLSKAQVSNKKYWLKKQGRLPANNSAAADTPKTKLDINSITPSVAYKMNRIISLLSTMQNIPQTQVLSLGVRFTDDMGKIWRLDLQNESGEKK